VPVAMSTPSQELNFNRMYHAHEALVRKIVRGFRVPKAIEDELVQEVFVTAWESMSTLRNQASATAWIKVVAKNKCLTLARKKKVEDRRIVLVDEYEHVELNEEADDRTILGLPLEQFEEYASLLETLIGEHKHPIRRKVAEMFYVQHLSTVDISDQLDIPQNTVLSHLRRFRLVATSAIVAWMEGTETHSEQDKLRC
jgi:RNA polymerase sigma-70 factor (ECF subfamily)